MQVDYDIQEQLGSPGIGHPSLDIDRASMCCRPSVSSSASPSIASAAAGPSPGLVAVLLVVPFMTWRLGFGPLIMLAAILGLLH